MPRKGWIDKSKATTFQLVYRPQDDPRIHDESSDSMVFRPLDPSQAHKSKSRGDLESELFSSSSDQYAGSTTVRDNEGEAAEHGIYFDDTEYDYMQHMRGLDSGDGSGQSVFVEAMGGNKRGKRKANTSLEDALRDSSLEDEQSGSSALSTVGSFQDIMPTSSKSLQRGIEAQQDVPDTLAGFQPDMDPRLREVLEALDDDAYVEDEEETYGEIAKDREELSLDEFEDMLYEDVDEDEDGWESDVTEKPQLEYKDSDTPVERLSEADLSMLNAPLSDVPDVQQAGDDGGPSAAVEGDWMKEFSKFKQDQKTAKPRSKTPALDADLQSSLMTGTSSIASGRKKRKGALTSSTGFSMTSSALARTEGLTTLDRRFDKIEEEYADDMDNFNNNNNQPMRTSMIDDDTASIASTTKTSTTSSSTAPSLQAVRSDFNNIMDDFLAGHHIHPGKSKRVKRGARQTGMEQLDEVRLGLGPARIVRSKASSSSSS